MNEPAAALGAEVTVVAFVARESTPCAAFRALLSEVLGGAPAHVQLLCLEIDDNPMTAGRYDVSVLPTVLIFRHGVLRDRLVGTRSSERLRHELAPHLV